MKPARAIYGSDDLAISVYYYYYYFLGPLRWNLHLMVFIKCYIYNIEICQVTAVCIIRLLLNEHNFSRLLFVRSIHFCVEILSTDNLIQLRKFVAAASRALCNNSVI